jgi:hypothetical protein
MMHSVAEVVRLAIDNNMSARARLVEIVFEQERTYEIVVGTTRVEDSVCAAQLEAAIAVVLGLQPEQVNIIVTLVKQEDVVLHFGVYERMLGEKLGGCTTEPVIAPFASWHVRSLSRRSARDSVMRMQGRNGRNGTVMLPPRVARANAPRSRRVVLDAVAEVNHLTCAIWPACDADWCLIPARHARC